MRKVTINKKWDITLPDHRADRGPEWDTWEHERLEAMHDTISKLDSPVVFDIGAEEGDLTALYQLWGGTVVPFEPNPLVWPNIRVIWKANKLRNPPAYWVGFASDTDIEHPKEVEAIFTKEEKNGWPACAYGEVIGDHGFRTTWERDNDTPSITVDTLCKKTNLVPEVITIDVEGAELKVLQGAERVLKDKPVLFVSVHTGFMPDYGDTPEALHDYLESLGYKGTHLATDHEEHWKYE